ncbi:uncharacterized protein LAESUDRAFT_760353 [Laetiporus sulphureus 93-53]|uniref:Uncharacterized protein n=1 Tax=Laetiporus sulphureus 93-53 TaxID=1314785 RepID=A0A165DRM6_9APHY|nr:uncharacterized protein LAESUDRAFT_760353 [Laetiporus sulphureus 93-53]KZT05483.1 hypothetical protein LAESUDRAFT_760353 [Laetiporus sulphureus 93-53]
MTLGPRANASSSQSPASRVSSQPSPASSSSRKAMKPEVSKEPHTVSPMSSSFVQVPMPLPRAKDTPRFTGKHLGEFLSSFEARALGNRGAARVLASRHLPVSWAQRE